MGIGGKVKPLDAGGATYFDAKMGSDKVDLHDDTRK
jgi:hypothetical protein